MFHSTVLDLLVDYLSERISITARIVQLTIRMYGPLWYEQPWAQELKTDIIKEVYKAGFTIDIGNIWHILIERAIAKADAKSKFLPQRTKD